jgi:hypothetical protein
VIHNERFRRNDPKASSIARERSLHWRFAMGGGDLGVRIGGSPREFEMGIRIQGNPCFPLKARFKKIQLGCRDPE